MSIFELARRMVNKQVAAIATAQQPKLPAKDGNLPLGARVGSVLELPRATFALLEKSLVKPLDNAKLPVVAVSRLRLVDSDDLMLVRYYTSCGAHRAGEGESFLQVLAHGDEIMDVGYYQFFLRNIPQTADEQAAYTGNGYGLGEVSFMLAEDMMQAAGMASAKIQEILDGQEALEFVRDTPASDEYIPPFQARENRIDDSAGATGLTQKVWFMPYTRTLPDAGPRMAGGTERLLVSYEVVESMDGQQKPRVHVDFMVGVALEANKVKVL